MAIEVLRDQSGREVYRVVTPTGVVGYISTEVPADLLRAMAAKLRRRLARSGHLVAGAPPVVSPSANQ